LDLTSPIFPSGIAWTANGVAAAFLVAVLLRVEWRRLAGVERLNAWLLTAAFIAVLWAIRAKVASGLNLHLSGAALFALVYGWRLATVGMALVCIAMTVAGRVLPVNLGVEFLVNGAFPVTVAYGVFLVSEAYLPRNFFVYVFVPAFFGPWATTAALAGITSTLLLVSGAYSWWLLADAFLPFFLILGFSEGFITGFIVTMLVVYKPDWVYTFRDERYIKGK
jgi:uncharacterized membrane protein